jgi:hypothetical protein
MKPRISIRGIMGVVVFVAVVIAAWRGATQAWASIVFNLIAFILLIASYKARYSRGTAGAWWFGFALCGWAYLVLAIATGPENYLETPADVLLRKTIAFMGQEVLAEPPHSLLVGVRSRYLILGSGPTSVDYRRA